MGGLLRWLPRILLLLVLLPLIAVGLLLAGLNTAAGRRLFTQEFNRITSERLVLYGVHGRLPDAPRADRVELRDEHGTWIVFRDVALDWAPLRLLHGQALFERLTAASGTLLRLPVSSSETSSSGGGGSSLPVRLDVNEVHVGKLDVEPPVAGSAVSVVVDGSLHAASLRDGDIDALLRTTDNTGTYHVRGHVDPKVIRATLHAAELPGGFLARTAHLPRLGALSAQVSLNGPWNGIGTELAISAGELAAKARGTLDLRNDAADMEVTARAPAMTPAADIAFQSVALDAHVHGPFAAPDANGTLRVEGLRARGSAIRSLAAEISGNRGAVRLQATAEGLRVPGPRPDLFEADPLKLTASVALADPRRPVRFTVRHKLLSMNGTAETAGTLSARAHVDLPDLTPFGAMAGVAVAGRTAFDLALSRPHGATEAALDGTLGLTGAPAPLPVLLGNAARIGATVSLDGSDLTVSRLLVDGAKLNLSAAGSLTGGRLEAAADATFPDLHAIQPTLSGRASLHAHAAGRADDLAVQARLAGDIATAGVAPGHVEATIDATGLPHAPAGQVRASGLLDGSPVSLAADLRRTPEGAVSVAIERADWKSAHAKGALLLARGATLPTGTLTLSMARLDDLRRLSGLALTGSVEADLGITGQGSSTVAQVKLRADRAGLPGSASVGRLALDARVNDPLGVMSVDATLAASDVRAAGVSGSAQARVTGPRAALAISARANGQALGGAAGFSTQARLDLSARRVAIASLEATARGQTVRLLAPARVSFGSTVAVDRLRLGLRQAVLDLSGRVSPTLDLTASLRNVTADLARIADPGLQASGTLTADARLTGTPARPTGTIRVAAHGLHLRRGAAAALPPVGIVADARLSGRTAVVDAHVTAGRNRLSVTGTAPIDPASAMNLRASGNVDLAVLNPILSAAGRRVRGALALDATVAGTFRAPRVSGSARLAGGEFQDFAQGIHLTAIEALIEGSGEQVRIARLTARAGDGTLQASGSVGLAAPMPVDVRLLMHNARPLAHDLLTATLDGDVTLRGQVQGPLDLGGRIVVDRADIRVPDKLPTSVAVLDVRRPGQKQPPPPAPPPDIRLDLTISSPGQIFVRGRGIDAELRGRMHLGGTAAAPVPSGGFELRRGSFSVGGQTLTFSTGKVSFDGSGKFDPLLDFVASSTSGNITANLNIGGYASDPKITLSSVPELPQDEVLSRLLFGRSAASLGPFQLASIAASLAQLTGASGSFDPLGAARQALGLDRLTVGGGAAGSGASIQAGRYIAPGIYLGAKQGTAGGGSQAQVQIDITKGLKLETDVGTGGTSATGAGASASPSGTGVGLTYQFEY